jgi:hypothetical protein
MLLLAGYSDTTRPQPNGNFPMASVLGVDDVSSRWRFEGGRLKSATHLKEPHH